MKDDSKTFFVWEDEGSYDLKVDLKRFGEVSSEVMYEDDANKISEHPLYLGPPISSRRYVVVASCALVAMALLIGRAFMMQGINFKKFALLSDNNRLRIEAVTPARGLIEDRNGQILAENVSTFDISVTPIDLSPDKQLQDEALGRVARITGEPLSELQNIINKSSSPEQKVVLVRDLSYEKAIALEIGMVDVPAIQVDRGQKRHYLNTAQFQSLAHILGYVGKISQDEYGDLSKQGYQYSDQVGKTGVEDAYEKSLRGEPGQKVMEVDALGRVKRVVKDEQPENGTDLHLTISADLQKIAEQALRDGMEKAKVKQGSVIVMDPRDGSLLAVVSLPSYDNNIFAGSISSTAYAALIKNPENPLLARAWAGTYPSGSTIKPIYALAGLVEGVITPYTTVMSVGGIWLGQRLFPDWKAGGHGLTNVRKAIAMSVNTFFYTICGGTDTFKGLGIERMQKWLKVMGMGSKLGLDVPGEATGFIPSPEWKLAKKGERWYVGDTYNVAIGQGDLLVTPLQIAAETAVIANGGKRIVPQFAKDISIQTVSSTPVADIQDINEVRLAMRDTVLSGTAPSLRSLPFSSAGKTGTAQWRNDKPNHAWFTSFAPFDNPQVVVTVMLEEGGEGSSSATPVALQILKSWYQIMGQNSALTPLKGGNIIK